MKRTKTPPRERDPRYLQILELVERVIAGPEPHEALHALSYVAADLGILPATLFSWCSLGFGFLPVHRASDLPPFTVLNGGAV